MPETSTQNVFEFPLSSILQMTQLRHKHIKSYPPFCSNFSLHLKVFERICSKIIEAYLLKEYERLFENARCI